MNLSNAPVIIVGAPRSGTNILRDTIVSVSPFITWPCDEINHIWHFGQTNASIYDDLNVSSLNSNIKHYIRSRFYSLAASSIIESPVVVEKTCANCLRLPFVDAIFPNAKYIYIRRQPLPVIYSAMKRWTSSPNLSYSLKKLLQIPASSALPVIFNFTLMRAKQFFSDQSLLDNWGPSFHELDISKAIFPLEKVCALQWSRCVASAEEFLFNDLNDKSRVAAISYENFVLNPFHTLLNALDHLQLSDLNIEEQLRSASASVHRDSLSPPCPLDPKKKTDLIAYLNSLDTPNYLL